MQIVVHVCSLLFFSALSSVLLSNLALHTGHFIVTKMAPGGPAQVSNQVALGDVVVQVCVRGRKAPDGLTALMVKEIRSAFIF